MKGKALRDDRGYSATQRREASEWLVVLRDAEDLSDDTLQAWNRWFASSNGNRNAFRAVEQVYHLSSRSLAASPAPTIPGDEYDPSVPVAEWRGRQASGKAMRKIRYRHLLYAAAAALIIGISSLIGFQYIGGRLPAPVSSGEFATSTSEHMTLRLADGSRVTLGARSRLGVIFTDSIRQIRLEAGEAFFEVSQDAHRPFEVHARNGLITALGTAFIVRTTEDRVTVAVSEGRVRVEDSRQQTPDIPAPANRELESGQQFSFGAGGETMAAIETDDIGRWQAGWLVYRDEPLRYVVADVARYSNLRLAVEGTAADQLRFTGAIFKDDVAEWILALPEIFPVIVRSENGRMVIQGKNSGG